MQWCNMTLCQRSRPKQQEMLKTHLLIPFPNSVKLLSKAEGTAAQFKGRVQYIERDSLSRGQTEAK